MAKNETKPEAAADAAAPPPLTVPKATSEFGPKYGTPEYERRIAFILQNANCRREDAIEVIETQRLHDRNLAKAAVARKAAAKAAAD